MEVCENANMQLMKIYIMCSCLGFIMLQRDMVAIHGGVIEMDNNAVIFTGDRGAGKSTLTTALREKGYKFISDDVAGIMFDKVPYVMPGTLIKSYVNQLWTSLDMIKKRVLHL